MCGGASLLVAIDKEILMEWAWNDKNEETTVK